MGDLVPFKRPDSIGLDALTPRGFALVLGVMSLSVAGFVWFSPLGGAPPETLALFDGDSGAMRSGSDNEQVHFGFCHVGGGYNCVVDGDTFYYKGEKIRVASIDAPESHPPRCEAEAVLADKATRRLHDLLNAGPFSLASIDRDRDVYGRLLRIPMRGGNSIAGQLVNEGVARDYGSGRRPWC